ncbi:tripartite tricarboxylate transporter permease [Desulfoferula mesophila]|uniref:C4-dicarboxylate ABC transporter permease n=1 Tax=Desulfoferula mesophila TaxID=3058419 RepID=A0AAU9F344_9BACT|nr:C4-dicarboxylate ABC transporter permease [Desulfoferula mesophilus]
MDTLALVWHAVIAYIDTYVHNFGVGIAYFFTIKNVLTVFAGVAIGTFFGAVPGMTITMSVALVMPFTFNLEPLTAISLLLAVYVGAIYGGSISAILLNTPGTPAAACTCMDGFALSQKGQAAKALQMANWASCVGDLTSTTIVILICPLLGSAALYFNSPEYFALVLFSVTIIGGLSGQSMVKGLIAGALGFLVAMVGMDPFTGLGRFDFGSLELTKGFSFVPLLIGLFAIPEVILQLNRSRQMDGQARINVVEAHSKADKNLSWVEFKGSFRHMVRGGIVGLILGLIPGLGATPASFVSYERARRNSPHPELFGKGSLEGVAAAESGNNGVNGATLVPLLTLGIPGDVITAVMLGAFMIFDLKPGPMLFVEHIDLIFGLFCALIMCDVALRVVGVIFIRYAEKIATGIPTSIIFPAILILCVFGSYSINNSLFDIFIMVTFGVAGYFMGLFEIPTVPFLIAFVLAPMLEKGLRRSLTISGGDPTILLSPIAIVFYVLTILAVISLTRGFLSRIKE